MPCSGTFVDFRPIRTRNCAQIIVEVPIETADEALAALGGFPQPGLSRWVALAPLDVRSQHPPEPTGRATFTADRPPPPKPLSQQCAIKCADAEFREYLSESYGAAPDAEQAAGIVRRFLDISTRSELDSDPAAANRWRELEADFEEWRSRQGAP